MAAAIFIYNHCTRAWQGGVPLMTLWMVLLLLTLGSRDRSQFVRLVRQMLLCADHHSFICVMLHLHCQIG